MMMMMSYYYYQTRNTNRLKGVQNDASPGLNLSSASCDLDVGQRL